MNARPTRKATPSVAVAVATAVADRTGVEATALPPLSEVVDPDALDRIFERATVGPGGVPTEVRFEYCGVEVVVGGDRSVTIGPAGESGETPGGTA